MDVIEHLLLKYNYSRLTTIAQYSVLLNHNERDVVATKMAGKWVLTCGDEITISDSNGIDRAIDFITKMAGRRE